MSLEHHHQICPAPYPFHNRFVPATHRILECVQRLAPTSWEGIDTVDGLRRKVATIEALMFACDTPPILITLVEDLYQSIDRLEIPTPSPDHLPSLLDAG